MVVRFTSVPVSGLFRDCVRVCVLHTCAVCVSPGSPRCFWSHKTHRVHTPEENRHWTDARTQAHANPWPNHGAHVAADSREASDPYLVVPTSSAYKSEVLSAQAVDHAQLGHVRKQVALKHALRRRPKWYLFDPEYLHRPSGWVFVPA